MAGHSKKVFVSYCHQQGDWVWDRLVPCLKAGGGEVLIDRERFTVGTAVLGQMDAVQDHGNVHVLVLSPDYLASPMCMHELDRAVDNDPAFAHGIVIPVVRIDCALPPRIARPNPLYVDLRDEKKPSAWKLLLDACGADLGTNAVCWLENRDEVMQFLERGCSVNLLVKGNGVAWRGLIDDVASRPATGLTQVDLHDARTIERRGLLGCMAGFDGASGPFASGSNELAEFQRIVLARPAVTRVAIKHFDMVQSRDYGVDLMSTLRYLMTDSRKLVLVVHSHTPLVSLRPEWQTIMSQIVLPVIELEGRL